jgi:hypothetical protein
MKKYEFDVIHVPMTGDRPHAGRDIDRLLADLDLAGANGWRVVGHLGLGPESFVMQREIVEE